MEVLIIGEGPFELNQLARELQKSKSFPTLVHYWKPFGHYLGVNEVKLMDLDRRLKMGDILLESIPREILILWKAEKGRDANIMALYEALVHCEVRDIAESLVVTKLSPVDRFKMFKFIWGGNCVTLEELLATHTSQDTYEMIYYELRNREINPHRPVKMLKEQVIPPTQPNYYIPRTLLHSPSAELDSKIFVSECAKEHVFLIDGMGKSELDKLNGYTSVAINESSERFIANESNDDFAKTCKTTTQPVHMIRHENGRFFWVRSSRALDVVAQFLKCETIVEQDFATLIASIPPPCTLTIADSPGTGKRSLLASLAIQIRENSPERSIHLFILLEEFVRQAGVVSMESVALAIEAVAEYSSCDQVSKLVLAEMLKDETRQVYLYAEAFDKVKQDEFGLVDAFLRHLQQQRNFKVVVTTRLHLKTRLETIANRFSFEMLPLTKTEEIRLLTSYWVDQYGARKCEVLEIYADQCLTALKTTLTSKDWDIAGIPLQCRMLGDVFAADAKRASRLGTLQTNLIEPISLFQLYKKLMELKFQGLDPNFLGSYVGVFLEKAIKLVFPQSIDLFIPILDNYYCQWSGVDETTMYSLGLVAKSPNNTPVFTHRTFAEYLVAEFIVKMLDKEVGCFDFLFGEILGKKGIKVIKQEGQDSRPIFVLKYPVTTYFIERHLIEYLQNSELVTPLPYSFYYQTAITDEDLCISAEACRANNLESTSFYANNVKLYNIIKSRELVEKNHRETLRDSRSSRICYALLATGVGLFILILTIGYIFSK